MTARAAGLASDVVAHDGSPLTVHTDPRAYARLGWFIVLGGVLGFILWASLAPLDRGVPMSGAVARESNRKAVQHLAGGTVEQILVKEGDSVKAGQVLVRLNSVNASAQADMTRVQYYAARAAEARLLAERDGKDDLTFPAALESARSDPRVAENVALQRQLFASRRAALASELGALEQTIAGIELQTAGTEAARASKRQQLAILDEQLVSLRELARDGYVPRSRLLDLERSHAQVRGALAEDEGSIGHAQRQVAELGLRRAQRLQEFQRDVRSELADVQKEAGALASRIKAEDYTVQNVDIKAPVDGVVMGLNVFARGAVVAPGFKLMEVVPSADALVVEGHLAVNLVDKVHPGLPVQLIFAAFNASKTPRIAGEITTVSADRLVDDKTGAPYYRVSARVTPEGLKTIARNKMEVRPGMPVELFVKTGERTMMSYLLKPIFDRGHTSMTEE
jgi:protease secretion system membrane fusion protein